MPGNGGCKYKETPDGRRHFYQAHPNPDAFREGERYVCVSSGGGGYGSPLNRSPESVQALVRDEYFSIDAARDWFGVVLEAGSLAIDEQATKSLRSRMREADDRKSPWSPDHAGGGNFWKSRYREGDVIVTEEMPVALQLGLSPEAR